jgi:hypothetical protein
MTVTIRLLLIGTISSQKGDGRFRRFVSRGFQIAVQVVDGTEGTLLSTGQCARPVAALG